MSTTGDLEPLGNSVSAPVPTLEIHSPNTLVSHSATYPHLRPSLDANISHPSTGLFIGESELEHIRTRPSLQSSSSAPFRPTKVNFNKRVKETLKQIEQMPDSSDNLVTSGVGTKPKSPSAKEGFAQLVAETARRSMDAVRRVFIENPLDLPPTTTTLSNTAPGRHSLEKTDSLTDTIILPNGQTGIVDPATGELLATLTTEPPKEGEMMPRAESAPVIEEEFPIEKARKAARSKRRRRRRNESLAKQILKLIFHHLKLAIIAIVTLFFVGLWLYFEPRNAERVFAVSKSQPLAVPINEQSSTYSISFHLHYPKHPTELNFPELASIGMETQEEHLNYLKFDLEYSLETWNITLYGNLSHAYSSISWLPTNSSQQIFFEHSSLEFYQINDYWTEEEEEKEWNWKLPTFPSNQSVHYRLKVTSTYDFATPLTMKMIEHPIAYNYRVLFALAILVGVYILIIFELVPRTLAAMIGSFVAVATLAALAEKYTLEEIVTWIDYGTITLLFSMMVIVAVFSKTGIFEFISFFIFRISKGKIWLLTIMFSIFTAFVSAFLDNVTTMLLVAPVTIEICNTMNISPIYLLITEVMMSNLGGTATPVGDPPVALAANHPEIIARGFDFFTFCINLAPNVVICCIFGAIYLVILNVKTYSDDAKKKRRAKQEVEVRKILAERAKQLREERLKNNTQAEDEEDEFEDYLDEEKPDMEMHDLKAEFVKVFSRASRMNLEEEEAETTAIEKQQQQQPTVPASNETVAPVTATVNSEPQTATTIVSPNSALESKEQLLQQTTSASQEKSTSQEKQQQQPQVKSNIVVINGVELDSSKYKVRDWRLLLVCAVLLVVLMIGFFAENFLKMYLHLHTSLSYTAIIGALLMLIMSGVENLDHILEMVEWGTLVFFAGLFVMMHALEKLGLLEFIGQVIEVLILMVPPELRLFVALSVIIWVSAFTSGFVDNIPFVIAMIPIVIDMSGPPISLPFKPLLMTLLFGCCLGGNATIIGASCNIVAAGISDQNGHHISFVQFFKVGFPFMIFTVAISHVYVIIVYVLIGL